MIGAFQRASQSILAVLGQDAFLRGEPTPYKINIEHGVDVVMDDQLVAARDVATIPLLAAPRIGDFLRHPDGDYVIDNLYQDNGVNKRYVLRPATTAELP